MCTNYVVGWMQFQNHCLMLLFSLIDVFCIDANKLAFFFLSNSSTAELTLLLSDSWSWEMSVVLKTCACENIFPPWTVTQCPHTLSRIKTVVPQTKKRHLSLNQVRHVHNQSCNPQRLCLYQGLKLAANTD